MSVNDAIDLIEQIRKCVKSKDNSEIKKLWGKLEDLARDEQVFHDDVSPVFVETKSKKFKHHKFDDKYIVTITTHDEYKCDSLEEARYSKRYLEKNLKRKGRVFDIVRKGMV